MANRSDFQSALPRQIKKMLSLMDIDSHRRGEVRRLFIDAHSAHKNAVKIRLSAKSNIDTSTEDVDASIKTVTSE